MIYAGCLTDKLIMKHWNTQNVTNKKGKSTWLASAKTETCARKITPMRGYVRKEEVERK